jgi:hypothetical protein
MMEKQPQATTCNILIRPDLVHPTSRKSGLRIVEGSCGTPWLGWRTSLTGDGWRSGSQGIEFPWTRDCEDDVIIVWIKDSWQPPSLLLESFRVWDGWWIARITGKTKSSLLSVSGKWNTTVITASLKMTDFVIMHNFTFCLSTKNWLTVASCLVTPQC